MLEDHKRTGAYYAAVRQNRRQFEGKVVLDVGTGSGILAIFAAQAGAKTVYAVEATSMAKHARKLVEANKVCAESETCMIYSSVTNQDSSRPSRAHQASLLHVCISIL